MKLNRKETATIAPETGPTQILAPKFPLSSRKQTFVEHLQLFAAILSALKVTNAHNTRVTILIQLAFLLTLGLVGLDLASHQIQQHIVLAIADGIKIDGFELLDRGVILGSSWSDGWL